jgi:Collagen triple helix repeat (20 copies)
MFQRVRKHLTPSTAIAFLALVFALTGGAFAASSHGGGAGVKASAAVAPAAIAVEAKARVKAKAGPRGPAGPRGATGAAGPAGAQGAAGAQGPAGARGEAGSQGPEGKQGEPGVKGEQGAPGTTGFTETLPSGKTLKGNWSLIGTASAAGAHFGTGVSFGIPLKEAPAVHYLKYIEVGGTSEKVWLEPVYNKTKGEEEDVTQPACPGTAVEPEAKPGNLCIYAGSSGEGFDSNLSGLGRPEDILPAVCPASDALLTCVAAKAGAEKSGFYLANIAQEEGNVFLVGTWAVTAE